MGVTGHLSVPELSLSSSLHRGQPEVPDFGTLLSQHDP